MKLIEITDKGKSFENFEITANFSMLGEKTLKFNAMRMEQENHTRRVLIVIEDVTEQAKAVRSLKDSEERFRLLVQNAFDVIMIYTKDGNIQYQSDSIERSLGYNATENVGKNIFEVSMLHPDDEPKMQQLFKKVVESPGKNFRGEVRLKHKNGTYKQMEIVLRNFLDNENIKGIIANYQDISNLSEPNN